MRKLTLLSFIIILFLANVSLSQVKQDTLVNSLRGGKWAIQFELGSYVTFNYMENMIFAVKHQLNKNLALRLGTSLDFSSEDGTQNNGVSPQPQKSKTLNAMILFNVLYYLNPTDQLGLFIGTGPIYGYYESKTDRISEYISYGGTRYYNYSNYSQKGWFTGGMAVIGVEWFPFERFSIISEYNLLYKTGNTRGTYTDTYKEGSYISTNVRVDDINTSQIQFNIVKVGISAYF